MAPPVSRVPCIGPVTGRRFRLEPGAPGTLHVVRHADGARVGRLELEEGGPGTLFVRSLCIDGDQRSYGAGSEAAELLLSDAERTYQTVRAWAPPDLGLAVYFWVRMGLSPLHGEGPEDGIWFERRF